MGGVVAKRWRGASTRFRRRAALAVLTALAAIGVSVIAAAQAATDIQWHAVYHGQSEGLSSAVAITKTKSWAVGDMGFNGGSPRHLIMHWNGKAWSVYNLSGITKFRPGTVAASAGNNVWIFGENDLAAGPVTYALIFNGSTWRSMPLPDDLRYASDSVSVLGPASVWAMSDQSCTISGQSGCSVLLHWNGTRWGSTTVPGNVQSVTTVGGHTFFLALKNMKYYSDGSGFGTPVIYEPTNKMYTFPGPSVQVMEGTGFAIALNGQRFVTGRLTTGKRPWRLYSSGSKWFTSSIPGNDCPPNFSGDCPLNASLGQLSYDGTHGFWAGPLAHYTGTGWVNTNFYGPSFTSCYGLSGVAAIPGSASAWGFGWWGCSATTSTLVAVNGPLP